MNFKKWIETQDQPINITKTEFENMLQRVYNIHRANFREYGIKSWMQWVKEGTPEDIALTLDSERSFYDRYFRHLPEDIRVDDVVTAYLQGRLPNTPIAITSPTQLAIEPTGEPKTKLPWMPQQKQSYSPQELQGIYQAANQRVNNKNRDEVTDARRNLFLAFNSDAELSNKLGITKSELNKKVKTYANFTVRARDLDQQFNKNIPLEHQWGGIINSSFLSKSQIKPEDLDQFVKEIDVPTAGQEFYSGDQGQRLRNYILTTFLSIDTGLSYKDLSFRIGKIVGRRNETRGLYQSVDKRITISNLSPNTVAHEIGHYLDHQFALSFGVNYGRLVDATHITANRPSKEIPIQQLQWVDKYRQFIYNLMDKSDIVSEYSQDAGEVLARFVDFFVTWTGKQAGHWMGREPFYNDKFTLGDCRTWVRLLQEKSFLDTKYPVRLK